MKNAIFLLTVWLLFQSNLQSQVLSEWRGIGRTGVYNETGLLKEWPENGPSLLWSISNLPIGNSSVSIANGMIFTTGLHVDFDAIVAMDMQGNVKWQKPFGRAWTQSYPDSRATPTIDGDLVYVASGMGDLACFKALTGELVWDRKVSEEYKGTYGRWGLAESLFILDNKVFFTPGGDETTMVALDKFNGKTLWKSKSLKEKPSYTSPMVIDYGGRKTIVNVTENSIFGVNPDNGEIIWTFDFGKYAEERNNNINTPIYHDGHIFVTSGYNHKSVMLKLSHDATSVSLVWVDEVLDVHHGGAVKVGNYIYGSNWKHNSMGNWVCLDWETGKVMYEKEWINKGSIISADEMLYCYEEKTGNIALVKPTPEDFKVVSSFKINSNRGPFWAHPVIKDGRLYIRHRNSLFVYNIAGAS
jgi:outer membrane protein assembly factor BamB